MVVPWGSTKLVLGFVFLQQLTLGSTYDLKLSGTRTATIVMMSAAMDQKKAVDEMIMRKDILKNSYLSAWRQNQDPRNLLCSSTFTSRHGICFELGHEMMMCHLGGSNIFGASCGLPCYFIVEKG